MTSTPENTGTAAHGSGGEASKDPQQIEADIARHRAELGHTVDELTERLDVKKQTQRKVASIKSEATERVEAVTARARNAEPEEVAALVAPVLGVIGGVALMVGLVRRLRR